MKLHGQIRDLVMDVPQWGLGATHGYRIWKQSPPEAGDLQHVIISPSFTTQNGSTIQNMHINKTNAKLLALVRNAEKNFTTEQFVKR